MVQGRVFTLDQKTADASADVVKGTLFINGLNSLVLIDSGSTHSFISSAFARKLHIEPEHLNYILHVRTPMKKSQTTDIIYKNCKVKVRDKELAINLIVLNMFDFDVILGMDWLATNRVNVDYYRKIVTFSLPESIVMRFDGKK